MPPKIQPPWPNCFPCTPDSVPLPVHRRACLMNHFADVMIQQRWIEVKELFKFWVRSLDENGKLSLMLIFIIII
ncbi:pentatricopeptide repeat-containing protein mitochondrial-like isoform X4 [Gossypium australe]|uniref:Pentatricopeptide repeat-containing protein mitochondrial-like isoform X4 n=1 Tax=Gossypium australe TaxID=47621 RepID=A0A5B6UXA8_9ROSI|nr:pentatricopeptide repeat-containing protein mitochondrial-like isoform X4 [Gossypium australe]